MKCVSRILLLFAFLCAACHDEDVKIEALNEWKIVGVEDIDYCASDFSVGYSLFKRDEHFL